MIPNSALAGVFASALFVCSPAAQDPEPAQHQIRVTPAELVLPIGEKITLEAEVVDVGGRPVDAQVMFFSRDRRSVRVSRDGEVQAVKAGQFEIVARVIGSGRRGASAVVPVTIPYPVPDRVEFVAPIKTLHVGTGVRALAEVLDVSGIVREDLTVALTSDNTAVATVDAYGNLRGIAAGKCTITAEAAGLAALLEVEVVANPVQSIELTASADEFRTGDVIHLTAACRDAAGQAVDGVPVHYSFHASQDDDLGPGASGQIKQDGRFVAETPGLYTVVATCGTAVAQRTLRAEPRNVGMKLEEVGHGPVLDVHTSDLWVWEGVDGRDYAVTGTWGANGEAIFWDVTDPAQIERISSFTVDARTVNDVKVSEDGRICVISREGASNRRNGFVVLNVEDPRNPVALSRFDENLTGGVHNVFIYDRHVYALSAGRRYDVINIEDPEVPFRIGTFELETPGHSIHDVWVDDGIAYSSNWRDGVFMVDVGNGIAGGSPAEPVAMGSYAYPSGWNHAAFPYRNEETGKFYVIAGDEAFPFGLHTRDKPTYARGWFHFIDFTDMENPVEIARYQVPEAGTHNLWVEDDILYAAYYNGGVRVVDISGELMGDLYRQGREIAWFLPTHPESVVPNASMVWGPQPHKGHIFFSDWNSGLWAVKLVPDDRRRR